MSNKPELLPCKLCGTERDETTLTLEGICPFCIDTNAAVVNSVDLKQESTEIEPETPDEEVTFPKREAKRGQIPNSAPDTEPYEPPKFDTDRAKRNPKQELAYRELCKRKLMPFIQRFRPKYQAGWVHEDICRRLERFVAQVEAGEEPRLLLMMPPRAGKSEIGSRHLPAWVLGKHPDWEIIAASHTASLTLSFSRYLRDLMLDPAYQVVFPNGKLDPSSRSVENWSTTGGGGYLAAGVGTGITGRGAHILLLDDLVKDIEAADSVTIKENTWEWYISTAHSRLAPGGGVLGIMTWWSEDDWAGRIQQVMATGEGDQFEIVKYPALNEEGPEYILEDDEIVQIPPGAPIPAGARLTRHHNTALHPARYTTDALLKKKRNYFAAGMKRMWQSLYQQNPLPDDGILFTKEMIKYYTHRPPRAAAVIYQAWDFAITVDKQNDYIVCVTILQDQFDDLYVLNVLRFKTADGNEIVDAIIDNSIAWKANLLGFEDGQIWKTMAAQYAKRCQERRHYTSFEILPPVTDKIVRSSPLRGRMQVGKVYIAKNQSWTEAFVRELMVFPGGKHDDQVDAASWAVRLTLTKGAPKPRIPENATKSWKTRLAGFTGAGSSHMAA